MESDPLVAEIQSTGARAAIPPRCNRKHRRRYDKYLYQQRNHIERCFAKLKQFRRFATRYEKNKECFHAVVALACTMILLNSIVDTP